jgi:CheY-like chemotaxis protein
MPGMNGYKVARRLRATAEGPDILLVALTGWGQDDVRTRVKEASFDTHLIKPVNLGAITKLLADRLALLLRGTSLGKKWAGHPGGWPAIMGLPGLVYWHPM